MNRICLYLALTTLAHTALCEVPSLAIPEILSGRHDYEDATLTGTVVDVLDDETDPEHVFMFVRQGGDSILVPVNNAKARYRELRELVGATATFTGRCDATVQWNMRRHMGRIRRTTYPSSLRLPTSSTRQTAFPSTHRAQRKSQALGVIAQSGESLQRGTATPCLSLHPPTVSCA